MNSPVRYRWWVVCCLRKPSKNIKYFLCRLALSFCHLRVSLAALFRACLCVGVVGGRLWIKKSNPLPAAGGGPMVLFCHQGCVPAAAVRPASRLPRGRGDRSASARLLQREARPPPAVHPVSGGGRRLRFAPPSAPLGVDGQDRLIAT